MKRRAIVKKVNKFSGAISQNMIGIIVEVEFNGLAYHGTDGILYSPEELHFLDDLPAQDPDNTSRLILADGTEVWLESGNDGSYFLFCL